MRSGSRVVTLLFVSLLILQNLTFSQSATSSSHGTITDAKGLVIAGCFARLYAARRQASRAALTLTVRAAIKFLSPSCHLHAHCRGPRISPTTKRENVVLQVSSPAHREYSLQVKGSSR